MPIINNDKLIFVAGAVLVVVAFVTKPDLGAHQAKVRAIFDQARQNAGSRFDIGAMIGLGAAQIFSEGQFSDNIVFTTYETEELKCVGFFGQISCSAKK